LITVKDAAAAGAYRNERGGTNPAPEVTMQQRPLGTIVLNQKPLTMPPTATVGEACKLMRERRVGAVLVTDEAGRLVGIFTGRDAVARVIAEGRSSRTKLEEVMTPRPDTMRRDMRAVEALRLMRDGGFRHVPVVDGDKLLGVVSHGDFRGGEIDRLDEETGLWERL
jgi:CBS domain-containing protein